jgi:putative membrane protein
VKRILLVWACNVAALFVASVFISGISYSHDFWVLLLAGLVFGLVNSLVKPIVKLLALPLAVLTLGIAFFFVNLLMLYITSWIVPDFSIDHFSDAVWGTIIIWAVNTILYSVFGLNDWREARAAR